MRFRRPILLAAAAAVLSLAGNATDLLNTSSSLSAGDATEAGRVNLNGVPSDWSSPKTYPGTANPQNTYHYQTLPVPVGGSSFVQISFDDSSNTLAVSAYTDSYDPANRTTNYLGDPGQGFFAGHPRFFQVVVPAGHSVVVVVSETVTNGGLGLPFGLLVEGFTDTQFAENGPAAPVLTSPANGAVGVSLTPTLSWQAVAGATSYDVYFGTSTNPPFATNTTQTSYAPGALQDSTLYRWRVVARNAEGFGSSAISSFTTRSSVPLLSIAKTHSGNFARGQTGATYTVTVSNGPAAGPTGGGTVVVTEAVPNGMTLVSMAGSGWTCPGTAANNCRRNDVLGTAQSYPPITVTVNVAATAGAMLVNAVTVSGGGSPLASATDPTTIGAAPSPVLSIVKTHSGNFARGQTGATYTVTVTNTGAGPTLGPVAVVEAVPSGMTLVSMAGAGWTCPGTALINCTRSDVLPAGQSYPPITVTVNVVSNATSPLVNSVSVLGGGAATASTTDSTTIATNAAVLSIAKTHTGNFSLGQNGATYTVSVSNSAGAGATTGSVVVTETVPSGLTLVSMAGSGWICPGTAANNCTRNDVLPAGQSYPPITVTVNVATNATSPQVNAVTVSGGGSSPASTTDSTTIQGGAPLLTISKTHSGNFTRGQNGATYTVTVSNAPGAGSTGGSVIVTEAAPNGMTLVSMAGSGWTCPGTAANNCRRNDTLAGGQSYPPITVTVNVAANTSAILVNAVTVSGGGSVSASATDQTNIVASTAILTISKTHSGNFFRGQTGAIYTVTVSNTGAGPTSGPVAVVETPPSGLTLVSMAGSGWTCPGTALVNCTRSDSLPAGQSYPPLTVTVNVASNALSPLVNSVTVLGGGSATSSTTDSTTIVTNPAVLSIVKTHTGNFTPGQTGATYTVRVSNGAGAGATSGPVAMTELVPSGLTLVSMAGTGWICPGTAANNCTRSDPLSPGLSYPPITVTVNVSANASSPQVNSVSVSGGGSAPASATDPTNIASAQ